MFESVTLTTFNKERKLLDSQSQHRNLTQVCFEVFLKYSKYSVECFKIDIFVAIKLSIKFKTFHF